MRGLIIKREWCTKRREEKRREEKEREREREEGIEIRVFMEVHKSGDGLFIFISWVTTQHFVNNFMCMRERER